DGREELLSSHFSDRNLARATVGPFGRTSGGDLEVFPFLTVAQAMHKHSAIAGRQNILPPVAVPIEGQQSMNDTLVLLRNDFTFPISRAIHQQRRGGVIR